MVTISRAALDRVLADVHSDPARERCGLLLGQGDCVTDALPAANVHARPTRHFELDPALLLAAYRHAREGGPSVLGHYHSHPTGTASPSRADATAAAADGRLWLIVAGNDFALWRSVAHGAHLGRFDPVDVHLADAVPPDHGSLATGAGRL